MKNTWVLVCIILILPAMLWAGGSKEKKDKKEIETSVDKESSTGERQLIDLIRDGDDQAIEKALKLDFDINYTDENGQTALHAAAAKKDANTIRILLSRIDNVDPLDNNGKTPLLIAVENAHSSVVSVLMDNNADPTIKDKAGVSPAALALEKSEELARLVLRGNTARTMRIDGATLLHLAAAEGKVNSIKLLLELGALPETRNDKGELALDIALLTDDIQHARSAASLLQANSPEAMDPKWMYITEPIRTGMYDIRFDYGSTVLHLSIDRGQRGMTEYLIANGAEVNTQDEPGNTPLHIAVGKGYLTLSRLLIENGAQINIPNDAGNTPLHESLNLPNSKEMIAMLLKKGADPDIKNAQGHTPLHFLVLLSADVEIAEILLDNGAALDPRDNAGNTPLLLAMENETGDTNDENPIAGLFLSKNADIYAKNNRGITPAISALRTASSSWFFTKENLLKKDNEGRMVLHHVMINKIPIEELTTILATDVDPNLQDYYGNTAFHYAVQQQLLDHAKLLFEAGGDMFCLNNSKLSPLALLFREGQDMTLNLLSRNLNIEDEYGSTPLYFAIESGNERIVLALIENGANPNHANSKGITPLHRAVQMNKGNMAVILLENQADPNNADSMGRTALHDAVIWNRINFVRLLAKYRANMNARDKAGLTGLHLAIQKGISINMCKQLIALGTPLNTRDFHGRTPLFLAAAEGKNNIANLLVSNGAYLDTRDNEGRTALLFAIHSDSEEGALSLIKKGADIFAADFSERTPFDLIMEKEESAHLLLIPEIVNRQDNNGNTPLHLAILANASPEFVSLLLKQGADKTIQNSRRQTPLKLAQTNSTLVDLLK